MMLMWLEAWAGSWGMGQRTRSHLPIRRAVAEPTGRLPAWRRRGDARMPAPVGVPVMAATRTVFPVRGSGRSSQAASARRPFWIRVDTRAQGHAAIGGSFAEVCAALEQLAAIEDSRA